MEPRTLAPRPDVALANTSPSVTPTPPRASRFGEVLSNTVVRTAESAMRVLPGSPMMAVAVRGATGSPGSIGVPMNTMSVTSPQGPTAGGAVPGASGGVPGTSGLEASLQQSQDMNLYYLQIQESVNAQNRSFTALSNVLKAEHDTVKTAIGNIR
jgi:hypothetical protein